MLKSEQICDILNDMPNDIRNNKDTWKGNLSLYQVIMEGKFQAYSKIELKGH